MADDSPYVAVVDLDPARVPVPQPPPGLLWHAEPAAAQHRFAAWAGEAVAAALPAEARDALGLSPRAPEVKDEAGVNVARAPLAIVPRVAQHDAGAHATRGGRLHRDVCNDGAYGEQLIARVRSRLAHVEDRRSGGRSGGGKGRGGG